MNPYCLMLGSRPLQEQQGKTATVILLGQRGAVDLPSQNIG